MIRPWAYLDSKDREMFRAVTAFLDKRLAEQGTIDWALKLTPGHRIERIAIEDLLNHPGARDLSEPWATAWRLIEESWSSGHSDREDETAIYGIQKRLRMGDRSGAIIAAIVGLVGPRLKLEPIEAWRWTYVKKPRVPKTVRHLMSASLTSGDLIDLNVLELTKLTEIPFLTSLANALESAVINGLDIARRLGWDGRRHLWQLGELKRVYYVTTAPRAHDDADPDAFHDGIAPSVKLLHAVVARIADLQPDSAQHFLRRWRMDASPVHARLWAAMSLKNQLAPADEVATFLLALDQDRFWDLHVFPEFAELRAVRFREMNGEMQNAITDRIQKGPPRDHWPRKANPAKIKNERQYWAVRELRRIEVAGGVLPVRSKAWLDARLAQFTDLAEIAINEGFPEGPTVRSVPANPDDRYNSLEGVARLRALETALSTSRGAWDDDPAERANDWINQQDNPSRVLADLEATNHGGDDFSRVWNRFGWAHRPRQQDGKAAPDADLSAEAERILALLSQISDATLLAAIEGISAWFDSWENQLVGLRLLLPVWLRLWPIAVEVTNRRPDKDDDADLRVTARSPGDDQDTHASEALNTPAGKLVGVFLATWRNHQGPQNPFYTGGILQQMRDTLIATSGRSGLLVRYRLIEYLPFFLTADLQWTEQHLIEPLMHDDAAALVLWSAIARRTHFTKVLKTIGDAMAERATDRRLGRETRRRLVFSLVIESLHAFREGRNPAVSNEQIQQMLRTLEDEVRASAANAVQVFVRNLSAKPLPDQFVNTPDGLFRSAAEPFLQNVWPQERSLSTPGVSGALADLPATSGEAFAEAVDAIERFLVPFECWSMLNYGLYGDEGETKKIAIINDESKARALLRLLDLTIGTSEGAVVPHDLTDALDQISSVVPALAGSPVFRRLSTVARR